jgi:hypothetical protein
MPIQRVTRQEIRDAINAGYKVAEIMQLLDVTHTQVTRERKYLGIGKWALVTPGSAMPVTPTRSTVDKMHLIRTMLIDEKKYSDILAELHCGTNTITRVKNELKAEGYRFNSRGRIISPARKSKPDPETVTGSDSMAMQLVAGAFGATITPSAPIFEDGTVTISADPDIQSQPSEGLSPLDYVNAFEERVLEYHKKVAALEATIRKLTDDNRKLQSNLTQALYQARNWQPNSLVRTSLANGG